MSIDYACAVTMFLQKLVDNLVFLNKRLCFEWHLVKFACIALCILTLLVIPSCVAFECTLFVTIMMPLLPFFRIWASSLASCCHLSCILLPNRDLTSSEPPDKESSSNDS